MIRLSVWSGAHFENLFPAHAGIKPRAHTSAGVFVVQVALLSHMEAAAEEALEVWEEAGSPDEIEIGLASDDHEARALGWPCVGSHLAVIRRLWELLPPGVRVIVVPRGPTVLRTAPPITDSPALPP